MLGGDISGDLEASTPRVMVVWEGYMASSPESLPKASKQGPRPPRLGKLVKSGRMAFAALKGGDPIDDYWRTTISAYTINMKVVDAMQQLAWRTNIGFDVITYLPVAAGDHLDDWLNLHWSHFGPVMHTSPEILARRLAHLPAVQVVCDPDVTRALMYGSKGLHVSPSNPTFWR